MRKLHSLLISLLLVAFLSFFAPAGANEKVEDFGEAEKLAGELLQYAVLDNSGNIAYFDSGRARAEGASSIIVDSAVSYNMEKSVSNVGKPFLSSVAHQPQIGIPVHGNWCGPGVSGPGAPVDLLDSRCRTHDLCYAEKGYFNKSCDRQLVALITVDLELNKYSGWVKAKAFAIRQVFFPNGFIW